MDDVAQGHVAAEEKVGGVGGVGRGGGGGINWAAAAARGGFCVLFPRQCYFFFLVGTEDEGSPLLPLTLFVCVCVCMCVCVCVYVCGGMFKIEGCIFDMGAEPAISLEVT